MEFAEMRFKRNHGERDTMEDSDLDMRKRKGKGLVVVIRESKKKRNYSDKSVH